MSPRDQAGRIRLEGKLEVIEEVAAALESATHELRQNAPRGVQEAIERRLAPQTTNTEAAVRRLHGDHPEVAAALARLENAWNRLEQALAGRVARLGSPGVSVQAAARLVEEEPIRYSGRTTLLGHPPFILTMAVMLVLPVTAAISSSICLLVMAGPMLALLGVVYVLPGIEPLLLTERRLRVGRDVYPLANLRSVHVDYEVPLSIKSKQRPMSVSLVYAAGGVRRFSLPEFPGELRRQLIRLGINVR